MCCHLREPRVRALSGMEDEFQFELLRLIWVKFPQGLVAGSLQFRFEAFHRHGSFVIGRRDRG